MFFPHYCVVCSVFQRINFTKNSLSRQTVEGNHWVYRWWVGLFWLVYSVNVPFFLYSDWHFSVQVFSMFLNTAAPVNLSHHTISVNFAPFPACSTICSHTWKDGNTVTDTWWVLLPLYGYLKGSGLKGYLFICVILWWIEKGLPWQSGLRRGRGSERSCPQEVDKGSWNWSGENGGERDT